MVKDAIGKHDGVIEISILILYMCNNDDARSLKLVDASPDIYGALIDSSRGIDNKDRTIALRQGLC